MRHPILALQEATGGEAGTYIVLGVALLVLLLSLLGFVYMVVLRRGWGSGLIRHRYLGRMDEVLSARAPRGWRFIRGRFTVGQWHGLALTIGTLALALGGLAFAYIAESWLDERTLYRLDERASAWIAASMGDDATAFMRTVTRFGDSEVVIALAIAIGLYLAYRRYYWHILTLLLAPGLGSLAVVVFKLLFGRTRPTEEAAAMLGHSFPSGHAFAAMAFYGLMIYLIWRQVRNDWIRVVTTILFVLIIVLVGVSRIMLRVHWLSDVLGGFTLALAWLVCSIVLTYAIQSIVSTSRRPPPDFQPAND